MHGVVFLDAMLAYLGAGIGRLAVRVLANIGGGHGLRSTRAFFFVCVRVSSSLPLTAGMDSSFPGSRNN